MGISAHLSSQSNILHYSAAVPKVTTLREAALSCHCHFHCQNGWQPGTTLCCLRRNCWFQCRSSVTHGCHCFLAETPSLPFRKYYQEQNAFYLLLSFFSGMAASHGQNITQIQLAKTSGKCSLQAFYVVAQKISKGIEGQVWG